MLISSIKDLMSASTSGRGAAWAGGSSEWEPKPAAPSFEPFPLKETKRNGAPQPELIFPKLRPPGVDFSKRRDRSGGRMVDDGGWADEREGESWVECPVCFEHVQERWIESHMEACFEKEARWHAAKPEPTERYAHIIELLKPLLPLAEQPAQSRQFGHYVWAAVEGRSIAMMERAGGLKEDFFQLTSANMGTLSLYQDHIYSWTDATVVAIQETRCDAAQLAAQKRIALTQGWWLSPGEPLPTTPITLRGDPDPNVHTKGGVVVLGRIPTKPEQISTFDDDGQELRSSTRWHSTLMPVGVGKFQLFYDSYYGVAGCREWQRTANNRWLAALFRVAHSRGPNSLQALCMDGNTDLLANLIISEAKHRFGWVEAAHLQEAEDGVAPDLTYSLNSD